MYNPYINSFNTSGDFETYIESSAPKAPNVAYLKDLDQVRYTTMLPNDYVVFGTTTGSTDFTSCGITFKVAQATDGGDNILYVESSGVPQSLTSLSSCFNNTEGRKITSIKKWAIDTSNVTNMDSMFNNCQLLTSVDLSSFNTSNVTNMSHMFTSWSNVVVFDFSSFDTTNVTNFSNMISYTSSARKIYISSSFFNSTATTNYNMFNGVQNWTDADSLEQFVQAAEVVDGTSKTIQLNSKTENALTQAQKDRITGAGWTIG